MRGRGLGIALLIGVASTPLARAQPQPAAATLTVVVANVRRAVGHVRLDLCTRAEFLKSCVLGGSAPAVRGETVVVMPAPAPGRYAIQAYLDENDNHEVDQNFIGIPKEGVGFSNDAPFGLGPPRFNAAAFTAAPAGSTVRLKLRYLPG